MKRLVLLALAFVAFSAPAYADESCANVASTAGGTVVMTAANNKGNAIYIQNIGGTNNVTCSIGGVPVAVQHGIFLTAAGGNVTLQNNPVTTLAGNGQSRVPSGAVTCITGSSTSYVCAESW